MELLGIQFAPLNVPTKRRLQTLAASGWIIVVGLGSFICTFLTIYILLFSEYRYLMAPYFLWIYLDRKTCDRGGRSEKWTRWLRNCAWWRYYRDYFPLKLVKTAELDPKRNYLLCSFPHGVLATGGFGAFATDVLGFKDLFPGLKITILTLKQHFHVPFFREFVFCVGACSASANSIEYLIGGPETGRATVLIVGGASEALECKPGSYRIVLKRRKGFVKLALKHGTPLVPVFSFGETDLYDQVNNPEGSFLRKFQEFFKNCTGIAPVLFLGRGMFQYSFGLLPQRRPITVVVGSPMEIPKIPKPTTEQVDEYHAKFIDRLTEFFDKYKHEYLANPDTSLIIE
ncbi:2-acylglycerol O-acyltransferase 2-B-like [Orussus abietinus]|uniref:2-acylglycerol O-acyltransferase 2-B-like n=1 Tax=Orussus abietinus TaxID=222816 RepID=UPI0006255A2A|nr:2-acylglycerol O-acyltransferase 2-B-like [Orussus abietinus]